METATQYRLEVYLVQEPHPALVDVLFTQLCAQHPQEDRVCLYSSNSHATWRCEHWRWQQNPTFDGAMPS